MKKMFRASILALASLATVAALAVGCASDPNRHTARVVGGAGKGYKIGIGENAVSQLYELGLQDVDMAAMVVPISTIVTSNGVAVVTPDAVLSAEYGGKATFFGSGSSTYTIAVGPNAVTTLLGGAHIPINSPYWTTNSAAGVSQTLPGPSTGAQAAGSTLVQTITGTNGVVTVNSNTVVPVTKAPGF